MSELLRQRIKGRLDVLGITQFDAALKAGLKRNFLYEFLSMKDGEYRKDQIRKAALPALAEALDCDVEYLTLEQKTPRRDGQPERVTLAGIAEAGAWRSLDATPPQAALAIELDPRFPAEIQEVYSVIDQHASALGVAAGAVLIAANAEKMLDWGRGVRQGDVVLVEHKQGNLRELTVRKVASGPSGNQFEARPLAGTIPALSPGDDVRIVALVLQSIIIFG